jgi:hypothetical protein
MQDVGLTGEAFLAFVVLQTEIPGFADDLEVISGTIGTHHIQQLAEFVRKQI